MGGKNLKFPARKKYVTPDMKFEKDKKEKSVSEEEHNKRVELLKNLGLLKNE